MADNIYITPWQTPLNIGPCAYKYQQDFSSWFPLIKVGSSSLHTPPLWRDGPTSHARGLLLTLLSDDVELCVVDRRPRDARSLLRLPGHHRCHLGQRRGDSGVPAPPDASQRAEATQLSGRLPYCSSATPAPLPPPDASQRAGGLHQPPTVLIQCTHTHLHTWFK